MQLSNSIQAPKSIGLPLQISQDTHPHYQGIDGKGRFMAARLTIRLLRKAQMEDIRFMLKIDQSVVFYGMLAWYMDGRGTLNPYGVMVNIHENLESEDNSCLITISMGLPYPLQYYRGVHAAVTCQQPALHLMESSYLDILASPAEKSAVAWNNYQDLPAHWSFIQEDQELLVLNS
jgi:hypothetical protein